jgi:hypothetical protein
MKTNQAELLKGFSNVTGNQKSKMAATKSESTS